MIKVVLFDWGGVLRTRPSGMRAQQVYELADKLRSSGVKAGILSNMYSIVAKFLRLIGDYRRFDPLILSCEVKMRKPDPAIYRLAEERAGVRAEEIIFVDNLKENIKVAEELGMKVVLAKNSDQVVEDVKKILSRENGLEL